MLTKIGHYIDISPMKIAKKWGLKNVKKMLIKYHFELFIWPFSMIK